MKQRSQFQGESFSVIFVSHNNEVPPFTQIDKETGNQAERSFKVPAYFTLDKIIGYLYKNMGVKEYVLATDRDTADPADHLELGLQLEGQIPGRPYIILDNRLELTTVFSLLYCKLHPEGRPKANPAMRLLFKKKVLFMSERGVTPGGTPGGEPDPSLVPTPGGPDPRTAKSAQQSRRK